MVAETKDDGIRELRRPCFNCGKELLVKARELKLRVVDVDPMPDGCILLLASGVLVAWVRELVPAKPSPDVGTALVVREPQMALRGPRFACLGCFTKRGMVAMATGRLKTEGLGAIFSAPK